LEKAANTDETGTAYVRFKLPPSLKTSDGLVNVLIDYQEAPKAIPLHPYRSE